MRLTSVAEDKLFWAEDSEICLKICIRYTYTSFRGEWDKDITILHNPRGQYQLHHPRILESAIEHFSYSTLSTVPFQPVSLDVVESSDCCDCCGGYHFCALDNDEHVSAIGVIVYNLTNDILHCSYCLRVVNPIGSLLL